MSLLNKALLFAKARHKRTGAKYNGLPFIVHPVQVAQIVELVAPLDYNLIAAAYLHDTIEDCGVKYAEILEEFNKDIADLVLEVTKDKKKDFPHLHSERGLLLKIADNLANVSSFPAADIKKRINLFHKYSFGYIHQGTLLKRGL